MTFPHCRPTARSVAGWLACSWLAFTVCCVGLANCARLKDIALAKIDAANLLRKIAAPNDRVFCKREALILHRFDAVNLASIYKNQPVNSFEVAGVALRKPSDIETLFTKRFVQQRNINTKQVITDQFLLALDETKRRQEIQGSAANLLDLVRLHFDLVKCLNQMTRFEGTKPGFRDAHLKLARQEKVLLETKPNVFTKEALNSANQPLGNISECNDCGKLMPQIETAIAHLFGGKKLANRALRIHNQSIRDRNNAAAGKKIQQQLNKNKHKLDSQPNPFEQEYNLKELFGDINDDDFIFDTDNKPASDTEVPIADSSSVESLITEPESQEYQERIEELDSMISGIGNAPSFHQIEEETTPEPSQSILPVTVQQPSPIEAPTISEPTTDPTYKVVSGVVKIRNPNELEIGEGTSPLTSSATVKHRQPESLKVRRDKILLPRINTSRHLPIDTDIAEDLPSDKEVETIATTISNIIEQESLDELVDDLMDTQAHAPLKSAIGRNAPSQFSRVPSLKPKIQTPEEQLVQEHITKNLQLKEHNESEKQYGYYEHEQPEESESVASFNDISDISDSDFNSAHDHISSYSDNTDSFSDQDYPDSDSLYDSDDNTRPVMPSHDFEPTTGQPAIEMNDSQTQVIEGPSNKVYDIPHPDIERRVWFEIQERSAEDSTLYKEFKYFYSINKQRYSGNLEQTCRIVTHILTRLNGMTDRDEMGEEISRFDPDKVPQSAGEVDNFAERFLQLPPEKDETYVDTIACLKHYSKSSPKVKDIYNRIVNDGLWNDTYDTRNRKRLQELKSSKEKQETQTPSNH